MLKTGKIFSDTINDLRTKVGLEPKSFTSTKKSKKHPEVKELVVEEMYVALSCDNRSYLNSRKISNEVIDRLKIGQYEKFIVYPIRKASNIHTYRFYNRNPVGKEQKIWQLSRKEINGREPIWIFPEPDPAKEVILLNEGETDAMCALSMGYNACTITGGSGTWKEELATFFTDKTVYVCYDIDDPGKRGRKKVSNEISKVAKKVYLVKLEDHINKDKYPHGDFNDYIAKENHTKEEFDAILTNCDEYKPEPVNDKVIEIDGKYFRIIKSKDGEKEEFEEISEFTVKVHTKYHEEESGSCVDKLKREISLISNSRNKKTVPFIASGSDLTRVDNFVEMCLNRGDFNFKGSQVDLTQLRDLILFQDVEKEVYEINHSGYNSIRDMWMFGNLVIKDNYQLEADDNGICWNGSCGYKCISVTGKSKDEDRIVPTVKKYDGGTTKIVEFANLLADNYGNPIVKLGLGLFVGSIYFKEMIDTFGSFPIMFVHGKQQGGKTEYLGIMYRLLGLYRSFAHSLPNSPSVAGMSNRVSHFSHIPTWGDEYRKDLCEKFEGFFRSAYDGAGRTLGTKRQGTNTQGNVNSSLILSGQELPTDEALLSRFVLIPIDKKYRKNELHSDVLRLADECMDFFPKIILEKKQKFGSLRDKIHYMKNLIISNNPKIGLREATNYGMALAMYCELINEDNELIDHITNNISELLVGSEDDKNSEFDSRTLKEMIDEMQEIIVERRTPFWSHFDTNKAKIYIWFGPLYREWAKRRKMRNEKVPSDSQIYKEMKDEPWYLEHNKKVKAEKEVRSCLVLDMNTVPESIKAWFPGVDWPTNINLPLVEIENV
jgi:5S rRNA maturation endonuclease (ribonuclease M5)